jgi:hypothetical protein
MSNAEKNSNSLHPILISIAKIKENEKQELAESYSEAKASQSSQSRSAPSPKSSHSEKSLLKIFKGDPGQNRKS